MSPRHVVSAGVFLATLVGLSASSSRAHAEDEQASESTDSKHGFHPHFIADVRSVTLFRTDSNYFSHANVYSYPISSDAAGLELNVGVELFPRLSLVASSHYAIDGADRDSAHLRLQSIAGLGVLRWALFRTESHDDAWFETAVQAGFGRYAIKETYLDPAISSQTYEKDDGAFGGLLGLQAAFKVSSFVLVGGYSFHYAPATINDRIGGSVQAGGHELSIGIGLYL